MCKNMYVYVSGNCWQGPHTLPNHASMVTTSYAANRQIINTWLIVFPPLTMRDDWLLCKISETWLNIVELISSRCAELKTNNFAVCWTGAFRCTLTQRQEGKTQAIERGYKAISPTICGWMTYREKGFSQVETVSNLARSGHPGRSAQRKDHSGQRHKKVSKRYRLHFH